MFIAGVQYVSAIVPQPMPRTSALAETTGAAAPPPVKVLLPLPLRGALDYRLPDSGIAPLPGSLADAIATMERSELMAETLGEGVFDFFLRNKRSEWEDYRRQVTPFELQRYLPVL